MKQSTASDVIRMYFGVFLAKAIKVYTTGYSVHWGRVVHVSKNAKRKNLKKSGYLQFFNDFSGKGDWSLEDRQCRKLLLSASFIFLNFSVK